MEFIHFLKEIKLFLDRTTIQIIICMLLLTTGLISIIV